MSINKLRITSIASIDIYKDANTLNSPFKFKPNCIACLYSCQIKDNKYFGICN